MPKVLASLALALVVRRPWRGGAPDTRPRALKRIGVMTLVLALAVAVSAVTATSASVAPEFHAATYPAAWKGTNTNFHGFSGGGVVIVCKKATFNTTEAKGGNPKANSATLTVHPIYTECRLHEAAGSFTTEAKTTGCDYKLHAVPPGKPEGSLDIECETGKRIEYLPLGLTGCVVTVFPQTGLESLEYKNEPKAGTSTQEVTTEIELGKIKSKATSGCGLGIGEAEFKGEYRQGKIATIGGIEEPEIEPAGHPATVVFQGFAEATKAQEAIEVMEPESPTVTSVEPKAGPAAGGTSVTITGTKFTGATAVKFGSTAATSFTVNSATSITATSPAGTGTVDVTVTTPAGTSAISEADRCAYGPTVTKVEPNVGPAAGGTSVTITGTGFAGATAVKFGSTAATSFTVTSGSSITATSPAGTGTVDVTVTTPSGTSAISEADRFTYGPTVTKVEPNVGPAAGGTSVTITGTGFAGATAVKFESTNATSFTVNSATSITATSPAGRGTVDVTVTSAAGTSPTSPADQFTYTPPVPKPAEFHAATYPAEWKGTNTNFHGFSGGGVVIACKKATFNTTEAKGGNPKANSATLTVHPTYTECRSHEAAGSFPVEAKTTGCDYKLHAVPPGKPEGSLDIECEAGKRIEYVFMGLTGCVVTVFPQTGLESLEYKNEPKAGTSTQEVTTEIELSKIKSKATSACGLGIGEAEFKGEYRQGKIATIGGIEEPEIEPAGHPATVVFQGFAEATKAQEAIEVMEPESPTVTSVEPKAGPAAGGTSVSITGTKFTGATAVKFGSTAATSFTVNSATSITATSPAGTGTVDVTVTTPAGTSAISEADRFAYGPTVTKVEPNVGPAAAGTSVTITGTSFAGATAVKFGSTAATSFTVTSGSSITATSPAGTGTVDVTVTSPSGTSPISEADRFTYGPTVTKVEPNVGPAAGGTSVTITGTGFAGATAVKFESTNATSFTVNSATSITATSPAGRGTVDVTVTSAAGTSPTSPADQFTYTPPVPKPAEFHAATYPAAWKGTNTNFHGFSGGGVVIVCKKATFNTTEAKGGNPKANSATLTVHPTYTECRLHEAAGSFTTEAKTTGCDYKLHAVPPGKPEGSLDIECEAGKRIEYLPLGLTGCVVTVFPQTGLESLEYKNEPKAGTSTQEVTTEIELGKIKSKATSGCGLGIGEAEFKGEYRQGKIATIGGIEEPEIEPAGHPATVVFQGFAEATKAQEAIEVMEPESPTVTSVEPKAGPAAGGTSVTITGTKFTGATAVKFGSTAATSFAVNSATSITATSPAGTGTVDVTVTTPAGTSAISEADRFAYGPTVTKVEPNVGPAAAGTSVTITGTSFAGATAVKFGSTAATSFTVTSGSSITATSPAGTGTVDVTVTSPSGTSPISEADRFTYGPTVTKVEPNVGPAAGGTSVTITGTGFAGATAVKFESTNATSFTV